MMYVVYVVYLAYAGYAGYAVYVVYWFMFNNGIREVHMVMCAVDYIRDLRILLVLTYVQHFVDY